MTNPKVRKARLQADLAYELKAQKRAELLTLCREITAVVGGCLLAGSLFLKFYGV